MLLIRISIEASKNLVAKFFEAYNLKIKFYVFLMNLTGIF